MKKIFFLFPLVLISFQFIKAQNTLPEVKLKTTSGSTISINTILKSDKPIILSFWATWCAPCINELEAISEVYEDWQKETGLILYAVSVDDARSIAKAASMAKGKGWNFELVYDENQELKRALNIANIPHVVVYFKGKIIYQHSGYTVGSEIDMYKKIKALL